MPLDESSTPKNDESPGLEKEKDIQEVKEDEKKELKKEEDKEEEKEEKEHIAPRVKVLYEDYKSNSLAQQMFVPLSMIRVTIFAAILALFPAYPSLKALH